VRIKVKTVGFDKSVDLAINRVREALVEEYRSVVTEIFMRLLEQTPQFTGRAVAHWEIGINGFATFRDDSLGDEVNILTGRHKKDGTFYKQDAAHKKGDPEWMQVALDRNLPKIARIKRGDTVHFCNNVIGDDDKGQPANYMTLLQSEPYWQEHLRWVNKPYEDVQYTIMLVQASTAGFGQSNSGMFTYKGRRDAWTRYGL
jgi:hypothetical protein